MVRVFRQLNFQYIEVGLDLGADGSLAALQGLWLNLELGRLSLRDGLSVMEWVSFGF